MLIIDALAQSPSFFIGTALVLGLLIGSFLNVVIYRVPVMLERQWRQQCVDLAASDAAAQDVAKESGATKNADGAAVAMPTAPAPFNLVVPRSACPSCKAPITALQNIPVLSWLFLRGKCANCGKSISARYPFVEALTGLMSAAVAWKFGFGFPAIAALVLTWFLIALTFIDVDHQLLPDNMTLPLVWLGILLSLWGADANGAPVPVDMRSSIIGAVAGYLSLWSVYHLFRLVTGKEGMGYGDFKLFAALGAWLGWKMLLPIIIFSAAVGAISGIAILAAKKQSSQTPIPFGPFLAAAGWLALMFGQEVVTRYLGMFAPHG
jgi:leader peptidase (prepilin peptidase)/N-methyltransferase